MLETKPLHSPLGASSAERWMNCPGSVALLKRLKIVETSDEPEYRALGTAAHEMLAICLAKGTDAWELIGEKFNNCVADKIMADAVQVAINTIRPSFKFSGVKIYIEHAISHPAHPLFYGRLDEASVYGTTAELNDYKHGEGLYVDVVGNPQLMYYAYGFLHQFPEIKTVILRIIQPRLHGHPPVRVWITTAAHIREWAETVLIPAMDVAELEGGDLDAGDWCRFCPAKLVCPLMNQLFGAAANTNPKDIIKLTNASLGRSYNYIQAVKFYIKALEEEIYNRLNRGGKIPGTKLVPKKANRVFKPDAKDEAIKRFGDEAFTKPELKSPAEIDKIGATGKQFTMEFAFTPQTGLTVAPEDDNRIGVKVESSQQAFGAAVARLNG